jgi:hypothetical protein
MLDTDIITSISASPIVIMYTETFKTDAIVLSMQSLCVLGHTERSFSVYTAGNRHKQVNSEHLSSLPVVSGVRVRLSLV